MDKVFMNRIQFKFKDRSGIAMLIALGSMIVILIIGSLTIYFINRGLNIAQSQKMYQSAFEACEGGIEIGIGKVDSAFSYGVDPHGDTLNIGIFEVQILTQKLFATLATGSAIKFARGYFGAGQGMSKGGVHLYYLVKANAIGGSGEQVVIEIEQKKSLGID